MSTPNRPNPASLTKPRTANPRPPLPPGWVWTTLGEITSPREERADPSQMPNKPYIGLEHIEKETGKLLGHGTAGEVRSTKSVFYAGDVLYGKLRPYLNKVCIPDFDGVCSTDILVFPAQANLDNRFLKYRLLAADFVQFASLNVSGVQHPRVHFKQLASFPIGLPPLPEQRRIVARIEELLSRLDAAEEGLRRVQRNLKRYRAAVLQAAVEGRLVPRRGDSASRPEETGEALLQRILAERRRKWEEQEWAKLVEKAKKKAAQARRKAQGLPARLRDIPPEEWQTIPEAEYARYLPKDDRWKQRYKEPAPPDTATLPPLPAGWVWATVEMVAEILDHLRIPVNEHERQLRIQGKSTLYPYYGATGQVGWIDEYIFEGEYVLLGEDGAPFLDGNKPKAYLVRGRFWVNNHAHVLQGLRPFVDNAFLVIALNTVNYQDYVTGTTRLKLNQRQMRRISIPLPPLAEQRRIVAEVERRLSVAREAEKTIAANLKRIARLRQAILKRAFEGRL